MEAKKSGSIPQWRRMVGFVIPYWPRFVLAFVAMLVGAGVSLVFPTVIQYVVDSVLIERDLSQLNQITAGMIVIFAIGSVATTIEQYFLGYTGEQVVMNLRVSLYNHLQTLSLGFFAHQRVGELVSRFSSDITLMRAALVNNVSSSLQQVLVLIGAVTLMVNLNVNLALLIVGFIPLLALFGFGFGSAIERFSTRIQDDLAKALVITEETLQGIREVKSFARETHEIARHEGALHRAFKSTIRLQRAWALFGPTITFLSFTALAIILWYGGRQVVMGQLSGGELISFLFYGLTAGGSFASLIGTYSEFRRAMGATQRVFEILDTSPDVMDRPDARTLDSSVQGEIAFRGVSFRYESDSPLVLDQIDLTIQPGEIVALVGPSGAGKSTLFNLIPRFYDPTEGVVMLDGLDLRTLRQSSLREQIGIVPQEPLLFGGTIRENLLYGRLEATEAELIAAAQAANAHEFIMSFPQGYETVVGERGVRLSGGQRQRIAIARALLKDPRILLLDEATSSLDNESEYLVQEALQRLMQGRTTIIIAHRLSTIRYAHRIAVLERGRIVELGTHEALLEAGGLYAKLYEMQFRQGMQVIAAVS